jgi:hypothetical protein
VLEEPVNAHFSSIPWNKEVSGQHEAAAAGSAHGPGQPAQATPCGNSKGSAS